MFEAGYDVADIGLSVADSAVNDAVKHAGDNLIDGVVDVAGGLGVPGMFGAIVGAGSFAMTKQE